ncbi:hypothetical protein C3L33_01713, partial [Rhododendron williamsianum]
MQAGAKHNEEYMDYGMALTYCQLLFEEHKVDQLDMTELTQLEHKLDTTLRQTRKRKSQLMMKAVAALHEKDLSLQMVLASLSDSVDQKAYKETLVPERYGKNARIGRRRFEPREESLYQKVGASVISSAWATGRTFYSSAQKKHDALSSEEQCCSEDHTEGDEDVFNDPSNPSIPTFSQPLRLLLLLFLPIPNDVACLLALRFRLSVPRNFARSDDAGFGDVRDRVRIDALGRRTGPVVLFRAVVSDLLELGRSILCPTASSKDVTVLGTAANMPELVSLD